jgi:hypothetical protein
LSGVVVEKKKRKVVDFLFLSFVYEGDLLFESGFCLRNLVDVIADFESLRGLLDFWIGWKRMNESWILRKSFYSWLAIGYSKDCICLLQKCP